MNYIEDSLVITSGQPSSPPPSFSQSEDEWTITLKCGRNWSQEVADSFDTATGGSIHEYTAASLKSSPYDLNFYFGVRVTILCGNTEFAVNLYFAQGNYLTVNNWWIGGNSIIYENPQKIGCKAHLLLINNNLIEQVLDVSGSHDTFTIGAAS